MKITKFLLYFENDAVWPHSFDLLHLHPLRLRFISSFTIGIANSQQKKWNYEEQKMEERPETLLDSLRSFGVSIPNAASSLRDLLSPSALVSICAQCLNLIDGSSSLFPTSLPQSTEEKFKVCTDISASIKSMGFVGDLSFYEVKSKTSLFLF